MYSRSVPVADEAATKTEEDTSVALILSPAEKTGDVSRVVVAVACIVYPPPVSTTVGVEVYPRPAKVTLIPTRTPEDPRTAVAKARSASKVVADKATSTVGVEV